MSTSTQRKTPVKRKTPDSNQVLNRLVRMINRADDFVLGFVKCNHPLQQKAMQQEFLARLSDKSVLEIELDKPLVSLLDALTARWDPNNPPDVVCVYGLEKSINELQEALPFLGRLNNDRDLLRRAVPIPLLIWLPDFALDFVARGAPDFWAWRSGVYEFPTERTLWQWEGATAIIPHSFGVYSLNHQDKLSQLARLEELLRTAQSLPHIDKRENGLIVSLLNQMGLIYQSLGHWEKATTIYRKSLALFKALGDQGGTAGTLHEIANIQYFQSNLEEAERLYRQSLAIEQGRGNNIGIARALHQLGMLEQNRGNLEEAERLYRQSLEIEQEQGNNIGIARTLHQLAVLEQNRDNLTEAERLYRQSLSMKEDLGDKNGIALTNGQLGFLYQQRGQLKAALGHYLPAWSAFREMHSPYLEVARKCIQEIWEQVGDTQFQDWLAEDFGPQAAEIRKRLDETLSAPGDTVRQEAAAVG